MTLHDAPRWDSSESRLADMLEDPHHPGKHIDPNTGIWPVCEWGAICYQGFVRSERFGDGLVIPGTNRAKSRQLRGAVGAALLLAFLPAIHAQPGAVPDRCQTPAVCVFVFQSLPSGKIAPMSMPIDSSLAVKTTAAGPVLACSAIPGPAGPEGNPGAPGAVGPAGAAGSPAYPTIVPIASGGTLHFQCANLALIPQFANTACPPDVKLIGTTAGRLYAGLTYAGVLHVGSDSNRTVGQFVSDCGGANSPTCAQDQMLMPQPGEYPIMQATITSGAIQAVETLWSGWPAEPTVVFSGAGCPNGASVAQTPAQVVITCN